jgi:phosphatidylglycerophosphatase A
MTSPTVSPNPEPQFTPPDPNFNVPLFVKIFASGLFSGFSPVASGTVGSAVGLALYFIPGFEHPFVIIPLSFLTFILGIKAASIMEIRYGHDPAEVTIDEVLGMWITMMFIPKTLVAGLAGFFLFRIMDIIKPWPARKFDKQRGGFGVMMDDVFAALYASIALHLLVRLNLLSFLSPS